MRGNRSWIGWREVDGWRRLGLEVKGNLGGDGFPSASWLIKLTSPEGNLGPCDGRTRFRWDPEVICIYPELHTLCSRSQWEKMWSKSAEGDIHAIWSSISNKSEGTDVSIYEKIKF